MSRSFQSAFVATVFLAGWNPPLNAGELSDNIRIQSNHMRYDLQYQVYVPDGVIEGNDYPVLLVTDGPLYSHGMDMPSVADELIESGEIRPVFIVFVDARNPDNPEENRRNSEFMCNASYMRFYNDELLPGLYENYPISPHRDDTNILGLSFGGLNSACFGVMNSKLFSGIGMHSPANEQLIDNVSKQYQERDTEPLRIFLSSGTRNDNLGSTRRLREVLEDKGHELTYIENKGARHNTRNWSELLDDALIALVPAKQ